MKPRPAKPLTDKGLSALQKLHAGGLSPDLLDAAVEETGISSVTLQSFGIGWSGEFGRYTFPMFDGTLKLTGFALWGSGKVGMIAGSRMGLFVPMPYEVVDCPIIEAPQLLILPQGPLEAAAVRDMGFMGVIGRPTVFSAADDVVQLLAGRSPQEVIVVLPRGDDGSAEYRAGAVGAMALIEKLFLLTDFQNGISGVVKSSRPVASLKLYSPPAGKTFREVVTDFTSMALAILQAKVVTETVLKAARWKLAKLEKGRAA